MSMDTTELHYITYDPDELWLEMMTAYVENGGQVLMPGDEKEMLLRSVQLVAMQTMAKVDNALRMKTLRYATGEYLDILGENRGVSREDVQAYRYATMTAKTYKCFGDSRNYTLPSGVTVTADGKTFFTVSGNWSCKCHTMSGPIILTCVTPGEEGNGVAAGTKLYPATSADRAWVDYMVVETESSGGNKEVSDDDYRAEIMTHMKTNVTTGTVTQIREATRLQYMKTYECGEDDVPSIIIKGTSDVTVYIDAPAAFIGIMQNAYINGTYSMPIGMTVTFSQMTPVAVNATMEFYVTRYNADGSVFNRTWSSYSQVVAYYDGGTVKETCNAWIEKTGKYGSILNFAELLSDLITNTNGKRISVGGIKTTAFKVNNVSQTNVVIGGDADQAGKLIYIPEDEKYYSVTLS